MRTDLPRGTVTFLFTDVEGSTKLLHDLGAEGYAEALAEHRRAIREACAAHDGAEVDTQGDAFFFAFPTAPGAIAAAGEMTEALASGPIQVRIGLHTGEPLLAEEGYVGDDVHFAARVAASGHGGQVILSAATARLVELELTDLGEHRLKDIPQAVAIFQLGDGSFPPLKTISNTNLPRPASSFVGREQELAEVLARIEEGARLVTLSGPGGTGKTRLAIEAAATLVPEFKAGVFWVGLAPLRDPALVTETIAQTLGAKDGLAEDIGEREMLLLLDNLEQVIDVAPELSVLLEACPNLKLLATSRELLRVRGEVEYAVPPLAELEAVSLFCERSQLNPDETIAELCRRLDSLPLAVELAAARTSALTPDQILERLSQRLDLLKGGRDADPRQQTLRAAIEWSYDLLSEDEQELLARLSVFAGGCTLEAAEEVAEADVDTLQSLVEKSLVRFTDGRYWMLETIREFACDMAGGRDDVAERHADYFASLLEEADPALRSGPDLTWLSRLDLENENVRAAVEWAHRAGHAERALRLVVGVQYFWWLRGQLREASRWHEIVLAQATGQTPLRGKALIGAARFGNDLGDYDRAEKRAREALDFWREAGDLDWTIRSLNELGNTLSQKDARQAAACYEEALTLARAHGDVHWETILLYNIGLELLGEFDYDQARARFEEGLSAAEAVDYQAGKAAALTGLGYVELGAGSDGDALLAFKSALRHTGDMGDRQTSSHCLRGLAAVAARRRDAVRAARLGAAADEFDEADDASLRPDLDAEVQAFARAALGDETYAHMCEEARSMDFAATVEYALTEID